MKLINLLKTHWLIGALAAIGLLALAGAMNGGTALSESDFDPIVTYMKTHLLGSTFVILLAIVVLLVSLWSIATGKGFGHMGGIVAIVVLGVVGVSAIVSMATATADPMTVPMALSTLK